MTVCERRLEKTSMLTGSGGLAEMRKDRPQAGEPAAPRFGE